MVINNVDHFVVSGKLRNKKTETVMGWALENLYSVQNINRV